MMTRASRFEHLFERSDDPWGYRSRWYEERKRQVLLAALSRRRYGWAFESGCANGELSNALALRCDRLEASDVAENALRVARRRLAEQSNVTVSRRELPDEWPDRRFDLLVISELAYFLDRGELARMIERCQASLAVEGELVLCHWRGPIDGYPLDGEAVHTSFRSAFQGGLVFECRDADFLLDIWCNGDVSVAAREGVTTA